MTTKNGTDAKPPARRLPRWLGQCASALAGIAILLGAVGSTVVRPAAGSPLADADAAPEDAAGVPETAARRATAAATRTSRLAGRALDDAPAASATANVRSSAARSSGRAGFSVAFRETVTPYTPFLMTATPGERVRLHARVSGGEGAADGDFDAEATAGELMRVGPRGWDWIAPAEPGHYRVRIFDRMTGDAVDLSAAVLVPTGRLEGGEVEGYRLGEFPTPAYRGLPEYEPPPGFLMLREEDRSIPVSPNFTLGQFPAKGPHGWPKYLVLSERLLLKLELILEEAKRRGLPVERFEVLSGFRSPWYNGSIGRPRYSRHVYGDAADIYVDADGDGRMDDLNGDGRVSLDDAHELWSIVEALDGQDGHAHLLGGLGKYPTTPNHGPFIHVDTRLYRARW